MNEVIQELLERKSVRVFEDREISQADKDVIFEATFQAPTAGNMQFYTILEITDQELKNRLAITCDDQPFIAQAKWGLVFLADCQKWYEAYKEVGCEPRKPGVGDLMLAVSDANIAAQNAVTAAWSLGIGSCYIGDIVENCEEHRKLLNLPEYVFPTAMLVFGYPTKQQENRPKPERAVKEYIVHQNAYHTVDAAKRKEFFEGKTGQKSYEDYMTAICNRKYNTEFSLEMKRSVEVYLKNFLES